MVGAGCVGLSTAVNLQDRLSHCDVTLMADRFSPNTTSDVSAGVLYPYALGQTPLEDIRWGALHHNESGWMDEVRCYEQVFVVNPV